MIEPLVAASIATALGSVGYTFWTLVKERYQARADQPQLKISLRDGASSVNLETSHLSTEELRAIIMALEDTQREDREKSKPGE